MHPAISAHMSRQHGLVTRRQALAAGMPAETVDRLVRQGSWTVVRRGVYAETQLVLATTGRRERRLLLDRAACLRITRPFLRSHDTAAYELDLDILPPADPMTHVTRPRVVGSHLRHGVKHHLAPYLPHQVVDVDGLPCLDRARSALDIAREHGDPAGVVAVDSARRHGVTLDQLCAAATAMWSWPGKTRVDEAIDLSSPGADSLAETLGRLLVEELGHGRPETQFGLTSGGTTVWCDLRLGRHVFEVDGRAKYRPVELGGLAVEPPEEVLWREKRRQDFVTGFKLGMSRIVWLDLRGARRRDALARLGREYLDTCSRFGTSIDDLAAYRPRGPRPRRAA